MVVSTVLFGRAKSVAGRANPTLEDGGRIVQVIASGRAADYRIAPSTVAIAQLDEACGFDACDDATGTGTSTGDHTGAFTSSPPGES